MTDTPEPPAPTGEPSGPDLARDTLHRMRAAAQERARAAGGSAGTRRTGRGSRLGAGRPQHPGDDPVAFGAAIRRLLDERGWQQEAASSGVLARWPQLVGPEVADHCTPVSLTAGVLTLAAESTAWATQLRLLAGVLLETLSDAVGPGVVTSLVVRGPGGGPRRGGRLRVPGGQGPRDTYG